MTTQTDIVHETAEMIMGTSYVPLNTLPLSKPWLTIDMRDYGDVALKIDDFMDCRKCEPIYGKWILKVEQLQQLLYHLKVTRFYIRQLTDKWSGKRTIYTEEFRRQTNLMSAHVIQQQKQKAKHN